jgi:hypothetical protein
MQFGDRVLAGAGWNILRLLARSYSPKKKEENYVFGLLTRCPSLTLSDPVVTSCTATFNIKK